MRTRLTITRRRRRRTEELPLRRALIRGAIVIAIVAGLIDLAVRSPNGLPGLSYKTLYAQLSDVGNLQVHNDVQIHGIHVGQVLALREANGKARVRLQLDPGVAALPTDTVAVVRAKGLLGARYVELVPGSARTSLANGATLASPKNTITLGVSEAIETFDTQTRGALRRTISGFGAGLAGRGAELNGALHTGPRLALNLTTTANAALANEGAARSLVPSLADAADVLDSARQPLAGAFEPSAHMLQPFADEKAAVQNLLAEAPSALDTIRPGLDQGRALLVSAGRVAAAAERALPSAPAALRATTRLLVDSHEPLAQARPLLRQVRTAVPATLRITRALSPVLPHARKLLTNALQPVVTLGAHGCDAVLFARNWRSFLSFGVPGGGAIGPLGEIRLVALLTQPFFESGPDLQLPASIVKRNLYPQPCELRSTPYTVNPAQ